MKKIFLLFLLTISNSFFAQTKMIINKVDGTSDSIALSDIKNITFRTQTIGSEKIFFSMGPSVYDWDIYMINPDGTNLTPVIQWTGSKEWNARVSPDRAKIAFISNKSGKSEIWIANIDGSNAYKLTNSTIQVHHENIWWSNDGEYIFYSEYTASTDTRICKIKIDGTNFQVILDHPGSCEFDVAEGINPINSNLLLYVRDHCWNPTNNLYIYNLSNSSETLILNGSNLNKAHSSYSWSPDGTKILFFISRGGLCDSYTLYIMNSDGSNLHPITPMTGTDGYNYPAWSADGNQVVAAYYNTNCDDAHYLVVMNSDGSNRRIIYSNPQQVIGTVWWGIIQ